MHENCLRRGGAFSSVVLPRNINDMVVTFITPWVLGSFRCVALSTLDLFLKWSDRDHEEGAFLSQILKRSFSRSHSHSSGLSFAILAGPSSSGQFAV
jgi:hypothetical protein